jgi:integrase
MAKRITVRPGIRCRLHDTRKHGVGFDRYWIIYFRYDGKNYEEGLGWSSQGWTEKKAAGVLAELQENQRRGERPFTLREKREMAQAEQADREEEQEQSEREKVTFGQFWKNIYYPAAQTTKRPETLRRENQHFSTWLEPVIGDRPLKKIAPLDLRRVRSNMQKAGRSPRTVQYVNATFRQVWNMARREGLVSGDYPGKGDRIPTFDNSRVRFLSQEEAITLLAALKKRSINLHDQALFSLHCGLRFGEVAGLTWGRMDFDNGTIFVDGKGGRSRHVFMTDEVRTMLEGRKEGQGNDALLFPDARHGGVQKKLSSVFFRVLKDLGWNDHVTDPRQRICYHTLRHTFCSWLVQAGTPHYHVAKLAGHRTLKMTERYSHLAPDSLRGVISILNGTLIPKEKNETKVAPASN